MISALCATLWRFCTLMLCSTTYESLRNSRVSFTSSPKPSCPASVSVPAGFSFVSLSACGSIENATGCGEAPALPTSSPSEPVSPATTSGFSPRYLSTQVLISPPLLPTSARYKGVSTTTIRSGGRGISFAGGGLVAGTGPGVEAAGGFEPGETGASAFFPGAAVCCGSGLTNMNWYTISRPAMSMAAMIARFSISLLVVLPDQALGATGVGRIRQRARGGTERYGG